MHAPQIERTLKLSLPLLADHSLQARQSLTVPLLMSWRQKRWRIYAIWFAPAAHNALKSTLATFFTRRMDISPWFRYDTKSSRWLGQLKLATQIKQIRDKSLARFFSSFPLHDKCAAHLHASWMRTIYHVLAISLDGAHILNLLVHRSYSSRSSIVSRHHLCHSSLSETWMFRISYVGTLYYHIIWNGGNKAHMTCASH